MVARQNGKDEILIARELAGLFVWGERLIIHSAHKFDTAMEHLERLVALIDEVPEFRKRVRKVNRSHGQEGITLRSGARVVRGNTVRRGYGARHQALRKQWARRVERGEVYCSRCGRLIEPGSPWDLGHDDLDRSRYTGPEHAACNRATATHRAHRRTVPRPARANWW